MTLDRREFTTASLGALSALAWAPVLNASEKVNRRVVLASRPEGMPTVDNFRLENVVGIQLESNAVSVNGRVAEFACDFEAAL